MEAMIVLENNDLAINEDMDENEQDQSSVDKYEQPDEQENNFREKSEESNYSEETNCSEQKEDTDISKAKFTKLRRQSMYFDAMDYEPEEHIKTLVVEMEESG